MSGTRNVLSDFMTGDRSDSGAYRSMSLPGVGTVFKVAGHRVGTVDSEDLLAAYGPQFDELSPGSAEVPCEFMGLTGRRPRPVCRTGRLPVATGSRPPRDRHP